MLYGVGRLFCDDTRRNDEQTAEDKVGKLPHTPGHGAEEKSHQVLYQAHRRTGNRTHGEGSQQRGHVREIERDKVGNERQRKAEEFHQHHRQRTEKRGEHQPADVEAVS